MDPDYRIELKTLKGCKRLSRVVLTLFCNIQTEKTTPFINFFFYSSFTSMCKLVSYDKLQIFLSICSSLALRFFFCLFLLYLTTIIALTTSFGLNLSEFIQATVHLLSRFSSSILAPCILLLLSS